MPIDPRTEYERAVRGVLVAGYIAQLLGRAQRRARRNPEAWGQAVATLSAMANLVADRDVLLRLAGTTVASHLRRARDLWPDHDDRAAAPTLSLTRTIERAAILLEELVDGVAEELARLRGFRDTVRAFLDHEGCSCDGDPDELEPEERCALCRLERSLDPATLNGETPKVEGPTVEEKLEARLNRAEAVYRAAVLDLAEIARALGTGAEEPPGIVEAAKRLVRQRTAALACVGRAWDAGRSYLFTDPGEGVSREEFLRQTEKEVADA